VEIQRGTISVEGRKGADHITYSLAMAGKPARLVLKSNTAQIPADRSGIAILSADIVDAAGVHVFGASPPLTWSVSGPATLAGPAAYQTDTAKSGSMEGTMYIDMPVANVLRSTATAGAIKVTLSAPGFAPAEVTLRSVAPPDDAVEGIGEPHLDDRGRLRITRVPGFRTAAFAVRRDAVADIDKDYDIRPDQVEALVKQLNPKLDTSTPAFRAFADHIKLLVERRNNHLIADDYNFAAQQYGRTPTTVDRIKSTLFVPDPLPPLEPESYGQFQAAPGVIGEPVSYATDYGLRVPAIVYRPAQPPKEKVPGIVVVNGHGGDKYSWYAVYTGILYAQAGATVLTYDPIGEGERNLDRKDGSRQHDRTVDPPEMARRMSGLMITDVMQAVGYLAQRSDTDPRRLAAFGYSMGSFVLGITCAIDPRLNTCVLAGGGNFDGPGGYWDSSSKLMCQAIPYQSLMFLGDRGAALYNLHAEHGSTLVINGTADDVVSIPRMGAKFFDDLRAHTHNAFDIEWIEGGGHRPHWLMRPAALWLQKHLNFPNWTLESIAKMPETHILDWTQKTHAFIDPLYATELREGGTMALGADFPAIPHDDMNALPVDRWQREKSLYIYETWLKAAQSRLSK
jgi:dienelactone hydrolase